MIILGMDMGVKTSCVSIIKVEGKNITLLLCEMVPVSITGLGKKDIEKTFIFRDYFRKLIRTYRPDIVSPELFNLRSFRTNLGMPISYLIGIMSSLCLANKISFSPTMPSSWKRDIEKKIANIDSFYDLSYPIKQRHPNHAIDSLCLALFQHPKGFKCVTKKRLISLIELQKRDFILPPSLSEKGGKKKRLKKKKKPARKKSKV